MSGGQQIGQIVGAVVGGLIGGPAGASIGASIGGAVGGYIDPADATQIQGPRLDDLSGQTASYGSPLGYIDGTVGIKGNVFWIENNKRKEVATEEDQGGKGGGGGTTTTTYEYFATFAVSLADHQIDAVGRVWVGNKLVANPQSTDLETAASTAKVFPTHTLYGGDNTVLLSALASNPVANTFRVYPGFDNQPTDPRMEADLGVANCPAYRGMAYIVFYDWPLKDYGNSIAGAQARVEVIANGGAVTPALLRKDELLGANDGTFSQYCWHLSTADVRVFDPQWDNNYPSSSSAKLAGFGIGGVRQMPSRSVSPTNNFVEGVSDDPDAFWVRGVTQTEILLNGGSGKQLEKNGVFLWHTMVCDLSLGEPDQRGQRGGGDQLYFPRQLSGVGYYRRRKR